MLQDPREAEVAVAAAGKLSLVCQGFPSPRVAIALHAACRQHRQEMKPAAVRRTLRWLAEFWPEGADKTEMQAWLDAAVDRVDGPWAPHDVRFLLKAYQVTGLTVSPVRGVTLLAAAVDAAPHMHVEMLVDTVQCIAALRLRPEGAAAHALLKALRKQIGNLGPRHASTVFHTLAALRLRLDAAATAVLFRTAIRYVGNSHSPAAIVRLLNACSVMHIPNTVTLPLPLQQTLRDAAPSMTAREVYTVLEPLRRVRIRLAPDVEDLLADAVKRTMLQMPDWHLACAMHALATFSTPPHPPLCHLLLMEWRSRVPRLNATQGRTYAALLATLADLDLFSADPALPPLLLRAAFHLLPRMSSTHASESLLILCATPALRGHRRLWSCGVAALHATLHDLPPQDIGLVLRAMSALGVAPQHISDRFLKSLNTTLLQTLPSMTGHELAAALRALGSVGMRAEHLERAVVHELEAALQRRLPEMAVCDFCGTVAAVATLGVIPGESTRRQFALQLAGVELNSQRVRLGIEDALCDLLWGVAALGLPVEGGLRERLVELTTAARPASWQQAARLQWAAQQLRL